MRRNECGIARLTLARLFPYRLRGDAYPFKAGERVALTKEQVVLRQDMKNRRSTGLVFGSITQQYIGIWTEQDGKGFCSWCGEQFQVGQKVLDTIQNYGKEDIHTFAHDGYCDRSRKYQRHLE